MTLQDMIGGGNTNKRESISRLTAAGILLALCGVSLTATLTLKAQDEETTRRFVESYDFTVLKQAFTVADNMLGIADSACVALREDSFQNARRIISLA